MKMRLLLIFFFLVHMSQAFGQENQKDQAIYAEAMENYQIGRLEQARDSLLEHCSHFKGGIRESSYRLLALCYLGLDDMNSAHRYAVELLGNNPYYTTTMQDPQRFVDMIEELKSGMSATITTASRKAENLSEVPVPATLITEEMIYNSGARNLQEVLAAYVPGMNIVDSNSDYNIAMRGVYNKGQEKILIMLNGHRLNSYCTNIAAPNFSISLDKVKQIEVLRGPASSLYGGVALTAVVNIITKQGGDVDGLRAKIGLGNHGQRKYDLLVGKRYFDVDILMWGSIYYNKGEDYYVPKEDTGTKIKGGNVCIGYVGKKPSYDAGFVFKFKPNKLQGNEWRVMYNTQFSQITMPFTTSYSFAPYDASKFKTFNGLGPSYSTHTHHLSLDHDINSKWISLNAQVTFDMGDLTDYQVINDTILGKAASQMGLPKQYSELLGNMPGNTRYMNGQEYTWGVNVKGDINYLDNGDHKGLLSFGLQWSDFTLDDVRYFIAMNYGRDAIESDTIATIGKGKENSFNWFVQLKHQYGPFILNGGVRLDRKKRFDNSKINELSPRLALIYRQPRWNVKLSYSKSFVDAPYLYRKSNMFLHEISNIFEDEDNPSTSSYSELDPESMHSIQLTLATNNIVKGLNLELNGYYNRASKLIYTTILENMNTGRSKIWGLELMGSYSRRRFNANLSAEWHKVVQYEIFGMDFNKAFSIPQISVNAVAAWEFLKDLKVFSHLTFNGKQTAYFVDVAVAEETHDYSKSMTLIDVNPRLLVDFGVRYQNPNGGYLGITYHNLFGHKYYQSGVATGLIQQQTRWWLMTLGIII